MGEEGRVRWRKIQLFNALVVFSCRTRDANNKLLSRKKDAQLKVMKSLLNSTTIKTDL